MKPRQPRQTTFLPARIRGNDGWQDAIIRNISCRGAMLQMQAPPSPGSFIELRRATAVMVAQVRWAANNCCGISTRELIDIDALKAGAAGAAALPHLERRRLPRDDRGVESAIIGRWLQLVILALATAAAALLVADAGYRILSRPSHEIRVAMGSER